LSAGFTPDRCEEEGSWKKRGDEKQKLPLFELSEWKSKGLVRLSEALWDFNGGRSLVFLLLPPSFAFCAMNKDIPADLNCVFLRSFFQRFPALVGNGDNLTVSTRPSILFDGRLPVSSTVSYLFSCVVITTGFCF
jgi:hypothetical protein